MKRIILGLTILSLTAQAQVVTEYDATIGLVGGGAYALYHYRQQMQLEANGIAGRAASKDGEIARLLDEAKTYESQRPQTNSVNVYEGRFGSASAYNAYAGQASAMSSNQYRLQADGVQKIAKALENDSRFNNGQSVTVKVYRVNGTQDGSISMGRTETIQGTINEVSAKLQSLASTQSASQTPGSIVKVTAEYTELLPAEPTKAASLRAKAETIKLTPETAEQARARQRLSVLNRWRTGGLIAIGTGLLLGMVRSAFSQEVMDMSDACLSEDAMNTKAVGLSLSTGMTEERVKAEIVRLCSQLVEK